MAIFLIRSVLFEEHGIKLSEDAIEKDFRRYQLMLAAHQRDRESLRRDYQSAAE